MSHVSPVAVALSRETLTRAALADLVGAPRPLARLEVVPASPSTNTTVLRAALAEPDEWPHMSAYIADHQTAGRGRAGRSWATPAGAALTASFVLRPNVPRADFGWAPLVVGLATVRTLRRAGVGAFLKWPNDVVVESGAKDIAEWGRWRKCVGILCETVPDQDAIVAGIGINVSQSASELPVPHAASLATLGAATLDRVLLMRSLAAEVHDAIQAWESGGAIRSQVADACATIGWDVAVDLPGENPVSGVATGLSDDGGLVVKLSSGAERVILAGDVRIRRA